MPPRANPRRGGVSRGRGRGRGRGGKVSTPVIPEPTITAKKAAASRAVAQQPQEEEIGDEPLALRKRARSNANLHPGRFEVDAETLMRQSPPPAKKRRTREEVAADKEQKKRDKEAEQSHQVEAAREKAERVAHIEDQMAQDDAEEDANAAAPKRPARAKAVRSLVVASAETNDLEGIGFQADDGAASEGVEKSSNKYEVESEGKPNNVKIMVEMFDSICRFRRVV